MPRVRRKQDISSLELGSYVEAEKFGVVALLLEQRLGEVDPQRAEGRNPVHTDADRQPRLRRIADEYLLEARRGVKLRRVRNIGPVGELGTVRSRALECGQAGRPRFRAANGNHVDPEGRSDVTQRADP